MKAEQPELRYLHLVEKERLMNAILVASSAQGWWKTCMSRMGTDEYLVIDNV